MLTKIHDHPVSHPGGRALRHGFLDYVSFMVRVRQQCVTAGRAHLLCLEVFW